MIAIFNNNLTLYNAAVSVTTILYVKLAIVMNAHLVKKGWMSILQSRKVIHMFASATCFFWPLYDTRSWSWILNIATPVIFSVNFFVKGLIMADPKDPDVKTMSRTGRPIELCVGPLLFGLIYTYIGLFHFKQELSIYVIATMGFGDGLAPLLGTAFPWGRYKSLGKGEYKTMAGSFGMFLGTILSAPFIHWMFGMAQPRHLQPERLLGVALVATLAEAVSGMWDNLAVVTAVTMFLRATSI